jgi:hypothetical protein
MPLFLPVILISYIANNRRAAFIAMAIVLIVFAITIYRSSRTKFWIIVPPIVLIGTLYMIAFWNGGGPIGAPAQAIRSIFGQADERDASSNLYRIYENINIMHTINTSPWLGVGFGQKFHVLISMADISVFPWWEYITHNSVLWIWMKLGVGGFFSLLMMISMAVAMGARALWRMPSDDMAVAALTAVGYIIMHFVFAYVDMSWDGPNMVMVATMMGVISCIIPIVMSQPEQRKKRWVWARLPQPEPGLMPVRREIIP